MHFTYNHGETCANSAIRVLKSDCGRIGKVTRTRGDPRYVKIRFDSDKPGQRPHRCHPLSVERVD